MNEKEEKNPLGVADESLSSALDTWRWRLGIGFVSFSAAWLISGTVLMWMLIWRPLAIGHALFWSWLLVSTSERMRRFYFRAIQVASE